MAAVPGPNRIAEELSNLDALAALPRLNGLQQDLDRLFSTWAGRQPDFRLARHVLSIAESGEDVLSSEASLHVARLWALDQIRRLTKTRNVREAVNLAGAYHLVTPVSGAVVLETAAQYQSAGLTPVDPLSTPAVPEPATWFLLLTGLGLLFLWRKRHRASRT